MTDTEKHEAGTLVCCWFLVRNAAFRFVVTKKMVPEICGGCMLTESQNPKYLL